MSNANKEIKETEFQINKVAPKIEQLAKLGKSKIHYSKDIESGIIVGLCLVIIYWYMDEQKILDSYGLFFVFWIGFLINSIFRFLVHIFASKKNANDNQYQNMEIKDNIKQVIVCLYQAGFVLKKVEQDIYWFASDNWFVFKTQLLVHDNVKDCTILLQRGDISLLEPYMELASKKDK